MAQRYDFTDPVSGAIIPVADGDFFTGQMSADYNKAILQSVRFFSDAAGENLVAPTAGSVTITGSSDGICYDNIYEGIFAAADACNPDRGKPNATGPMTIAKLTLAGVTGAAYFSAKLYRY